jgi:peptidoglycan-associated lipoprotein
MMNHSKRQMLVASALAALALAMLSGCATKGYVRQQVDELRTYTDQRTAEIRARADSAWAVANLAERLGSGDYSEVSTSQVQFAFDDFRLDPAAQGVLDQLGTALTSHPHYGLEIRGYADAIGTDRYNYKLGHERADEVLRYMITKYSVPSNRTAVVSFGEESPVADNASDEGRAQNRRVQVRLLEIRLPGEPTAMVP